MRWWSQVSYFYRLAPKRVSRLERRRRMKRRQLKARMKKMRTFGAIASLSITSILAAHMTRGTHALLTAQDTTSISIQTLPWFESYIEREIKQESDLKSQLDGDRDALHSLKEKLKGDSNLDDFVRDVEAAAADKKQADALDKQIHDLTDLIDTQIQTDESSFASDASQSSNDSNGSLNTHIQFKVAMALSGPSWLATDSGQSQTLVSAADGDLSTMSQDTTAMAAMQATAIAAANAAAAASTNTTNTVTNSVYGTDAGIVPDSVYSDNTVVGGSNSINSNGNNTN